MCGMNFLRIIGLGNGDSSYFAIRSSKTERVCWRTAAESESVSPVLYTYFPFTEYLTYTFITKPFTLSLQSPWRSRFLVCWWRCIRVFQVRAGVFHRQCFSVEMIPVFESSLRRDIKSGKVSSEKDLQRCRRIDLSELTRVYGELKQNNSNFEQSNEFVKESRVNTDDTPRIVALFETQVRTWKNNLTPRPQRKRSCSICYLRRKKKSAHSCRQ